MTQSRSFTLIGNFTDNITPAIDKINRSLNSISSNRRGGFSGLTQSIGKVIGANKRLNDGMNETIKTLRDQLSVIGQLVRGLQQYRNELGRLTSANKAVDKSAKSLGDSQAAAWDKANAALERYLKNQNRINNRFGGGGPGGGGPGGPGGPGGSGGSGRRGPSGPLEFAKDFLITNAIVSGFYQGVRILQNGMNGIFQAFADRTKDQLEDIASAGGIFSAAKFGGAKGLPDTFQGAMEMQDNINKKMAAVASSLPGTTQDFVINARRMTDTLAQMMSKNTKEFEKLAQKLSGDTQASGEKAFEIINVEVAKATTLLEKLNPTRTTVPMTQIVEDMMKSQTVSVAGLRRYVSFRRATTFEAALNRNLKELNAAGAGTADRLGAIIKTLKQAVPPELITAMTTSVSGVIEGFKSAITDPDVGIFGLSRILFKRMKKFNKETGEIMTKNGRELDEAVSFFKVFSDIFGNLGNLLNATILPGLMAIYSPLEGIAGSLEDLRAYSFKVFKYQQAYTAYYSNLADKYGMSYEAFKSGEKGGLAVLLKVLQSYGILGKDKVNEYLEIMKKKGPEERIAENMQSIYKDVIPAFFNSPFISKIFEHIGFALGKAMVALADLLGNVAGVNAPRADAFSKAFTAAGGVDAIRRIMLSIATMLGRMLMAATSAYLAALKESIFGKFDFGSKIGSVLALLLPTLFVPGIRNFVVAIFRGIAAGLFGRGTMQAAAGAAQGAAQGAAGAGAAGAAGMGGASTFWATSAMQRKSAAYQRLIRMKGGRMRAGAAGRVQSFWQNAYTSPIGPVPGGTLGRNMRSTTRLGSRLSLASRLSGAGRAVSGSGIGKVARFVPGGAIAGGAINMGLALASGESFGKAAATTIGSVIGGTLGSTLGPVGTAIGGVAGSMIGEAAYNVTTGMFKSPTQLMQESSRKQIEAANIQLDAASKRIAKETGETPSGLTGTLDLQKLTQVVNKLGISYDTRVQEYVNAAGTQRTIADFTEKTRIELNNLIAKYKREGYANKPQDIWNLSDVKALNAQYLSWKDKLANAGRQLDATAKAMPENFSKAINRGMVSWPKVDQALADSIRNYNMGSGGGNTPNFGNIFFPGFGAPKLSSGSKSLPEWMQPQLGQFYFKNEDGVPRWRGGLGDAISSELRHKPSGSNLVIANSSETVIPAAGGYGMEKFASYLTSTSKNTAVGATLTLQIRDIMNRSYNLWDNIKKVTDQSLNQGGNMLKTMTSGAMKVRFMIGSGGKGGPGAVDAFNPIAASHGLQVTSAYRAGDDGWHGVNRARDYSNGINTPQMMEFATFMAAAFGGDLLELIYTPLGFSIKNGQVTAPIAASTHYDHVHVAYGMGPGNPAFFSSAAQAAAWEKKMAPTSASIATVTSNSAEGFGGSYSLNAPISIYQQPGQDPEELASIVAMRMMMVIDELRNHG